MILIIQRSSEIISRASVICEVEIMHMPPSQSQFFCFVHFARLPYGFPSKLKRDCLPSIEGIKINMMSSCPRESRSFSKNEVFDGTCQTYGPGFQAASPLTPLFILKERLILELRLDELHFYYDLRLKTKMFLNLHGIQGGHKLSTTSTMSPVSK